MHQLRLIANSHAYHDYGYTYTAGEILTGKRHALDNLLP